MLERKNLKSRNHRITESRSFLVRYRRTYVLNNKQAKNIYLASLGDLEVLIVFASMSGPISGSASVDESGSIVPKRAGLSLGT